MKTCPDTTYNVFGGTLNPAQPGFPLTWKTWKTPGILSTWKTSGILCQTWNFWHDKSIYASFDILTAVLLLCYKGMNGEHQRMSTKYFIS